MNLLFEILFLASLLSFVCCEEDLVISLTKDTFNATIKDVQATIVEFYTPCTLLSHSPLFTLSLIHEPARMSCICFICFLPSFTLGCGFCQKLAPELAQAAKELKPRGYSIYKVDCQQEEELCHEHDIQGYPSIKTFM